MRKLFRGRGAAGAVRIPPSRMTELQITQAIQESFVGVDIVAESGDSFFFYDPQRDTPPDHRFPFATLVTGDRYDSFSNLERPGIFRLNIGIARVSFETLFGSSEGASYDFTELDQLMPHPVYGKMFWACVLNPSPETFSAVHRLLTEAYDLAAGRDARRAPTA